MHCFITKANKHSSERSLLEEEIILYNFIYYFFSEEYSLWLNKRCFFIYEMVHALLK